MSRVIVIGKEGNQAITITEPTVSRRHAELIIDDKGQMRLRDTQSANGTYIMKKDGSAERINEMIVSANMIIRLGPTLRVKIGDLIPESFNQVDISALRYISQHYYKRKVELEQKIATNQKLQMLTSIITIVGMSAGALVVPDNGGFPWGKVISVVFVLVLAGSLFLYLITQSKKIIEEKNTLDLNYRKNYICPSCHYSLGQAIYENILGTQCPKCHKEFIEHHP
jgi:pSer/pThr/pTyr-binding forkhead associated (FHA) protein